MSQTPIPQLPYDIIDNIITKMKMMEAKEMTADLNNYIQKRNIKMYGYIIPPAKITKTPFVRSLKFRGRVADDANQLCALYPGRGVRCWFLFYKYEKTFIYYLRKLNFISICGIKEYPIDRLKEEIKEFADYKKQLKALGMKPMSKMNRSELIRAIMKLE